MSGTAPAWRQFVMNLDALEPDVVEEIFTRFGAQSISFTDATDNPVLEPGPGETPLWAETRISGLFSPAVDIQTLEATLLVELCLSDLPPHYAENIVDRVWEREWLKDFGPKRFGQRLWICPTGGVVDQRDAVIVRLDPGLAFGTGTHPSTALCLEWLDSLPLAGKSMLDFGCGSGILAIAGLKLGCRTATGVDIDPQALLATQQNADGNDLARKLRLCSNLDKISGDFDVVVANILAGPLIEFAESITLTLAGHGMLALSGVLCEQADDVMAAFEPWIDFEEPVFRSLDGQTWSRLTGKRRAA